ncbi:helix-turn-helix domain-containing protein [Microbacterium halotolerans]|uniref:helix-turn-helix domain-containing protein n=1 Tax=Microbacterium halotolerans TaxID=246613 RepID=UPI001F08D5C9|nr:helix-turn-helix domain-containing protein [Microbacterium halotolerans]
MWGSAAHLFGMDADHSPAGNPWGLKPLLDVGELAAYLGVPVSTVYDWRTRGLGPRAYRFGKHLKFAVADVRAWVEQQRDPDPPASSEGR